MITGRQFENALIFSSLLAVLLAIPACMAPPGAALVGQPVVTGRPVSLDNILVVATNATGQSSAESRTLADAIASGLRQTEMFTGVAETPAGLGAGDGVTVLAAITALKPVTDNARDWTGPLAGRARIAVRVTLADLKSGRGIETFAVAGESGQSAYAGTTPEALQMAADKIVAEMLRLNTQVEP
jgi:hypothetical protein